MGEKRRRSPDGLTADAECCQAELVLKGVEETPEKRQKVENAESCTRQPLTRENLALLEEKMSPKSTSNEGKTGDVNTGTTRTSTIDPAKQERVLHYNGLELNPGPALETELAKEVMNAAKNLLNDPRDTVMKRKDVEEFSEERLDQQYSNESTFVDAIWHILIRKTRHVKEQPPTNQLKTDQEWMVRKFKTDGLRHKVNQKFESKTVPVTDAHGEKQLTKFLRKLPNIKTPMPDLAYGLRLDAFSDREERITFELRKISMISPDMVYPFLIFEFKSGKGLLDEAKMQACRGGAAMVYSMRQLREKAGLPNDNDKEDVGRMAFSVAMTTDRANIYVHWAHSSSDNKVTYYMAKVVGFDLEDDDVIPTLRSCINNILDWGVLTRKNYIKSILAKIDSSPEARSIAEDKDKEDEENKESEEEEEAEPASGR